MIKDNQYLTDEFISSLKHEGLQYFLMEFVCELLDGEVTQLNLLIENVLDKKGFYRIIDTKSAWVAEFSPPDNPIFNDIAIKKMIKDLYKNKDKN